MQKSLRLFPLVILFLCLFSHHGKAQSSANNSTAPDTADFPYWIEMMQNDTVNFFKVQRAFNLYYDKHHAGKEEEEERESKGEEEDEGFEIYKRWEYMTLRTMKPDGTRLAPDATFNAINKYRAAQSGNNNRSLAKPGSNPTGNWTSLGPTSLPANLLGQPNGMGRVNCVAFHPTKPGTIYVGAAGGGLWVTTDSGATWSTKTDGLATLGVSAIAIDRYTPNTMYMGTGDRDANDAPGIGILKSTDGGSTWSSSSSGLGNAVVSKIIINPNKTSTLLAATSGGIYRSTNSGNSWSKVSGNTKFYKDIVFKPRNPNTAYATENGNFYRSTDGGASWTQVTSGLSSAYRGVIAVSAADTDRVYFICTSTYTFSACYTSTDAGKTFRTKSTSPNIMDYSDNGSGTGGQAWYDLAAVADTATKGTLYVGGINIFKSKDSGATWTVVAHWVGSSVPVVHADQHVLAINPLNNKIYAGCDGGLYVSANAGSTWKDVSSGLGISEIYKIGQSASRSDLMIAGFQDNGTANLKNGKWYSIIGGDGMQCAIDPSDTNYQYGEIYYGDIYRTKNATSFSTHLAGNGTNGISETGDWVTPFMLHRGNANVMFAGYNNLWKCSNVKASSPSWSKKSSSLAGSNSNLIEAMDQSPADTNVFYMSRNDNALFISTNINASSPSWTDLTSSLPNSGSLVKAIATHPKYSNVVYIIQAGSIYVSTNKGSTWTDISYSNLPSATLNCIILDKNSNSGIYLGTDAGVYYMDSSMTDWTTFYNGLPAAARVMDMAIYYDATKSSNNKIKIGTYGRSAWLSDLYSPISPVAAFGINKKGQCLTGNSFSFTDSTTVSSGTITAWAWDFGDGKTSASQNPTHSYTAAGSYTVKLIATCSLGTTDNISKTVTVYPQATPSFTFSPATQCLTSNSVSFTDKSTVSSGTITGWSWDYGDLSTAGTTQNPSHSYTKSGVFAVVLTTTTNNGCKDTVSKKNITIYPQPTASYSMGSTGICSNSNSTSFTDKSTVSSGTITAWSWDFGDTKSSTSQNPSHSYASAGTFTVKLTVTTNNGCTDNTSKNITIYGPPSASFSVSAGAACLSGNSFSFTDKTTISSGSVTAWSWDFGDSKSSTSQSPSHSYTTAGTYKVKLTATSNSGCSDTISKFITVYPQASPSFTVNSTGQCLTGNSFTFTDKTSIVSGSISSWAWDFADTKTSASQSPTHSYTAAGSYKVKLTTTTNNGCIDTVTKTIGVYAQPSAGFTINTAAQCLSANSFTFTDKSSITSGSISSYQWTFGDATGSVSASPTHNYLKSGTFTVLQKVTSNLGCTDTISKTVLVYPQPVAGFTVNSNAQCLGGNSFAVTDKTTVSSGSITGWSWDFGDGSSLVTTQNPTHSYTKAGTFRIKITAVTNNGCKDTTSGVVIVYPQPTVSFTINNATQCLTGNSFSFAEKTTLPGTGYVLSDKWSFGDGSVNTSATPAYSYKTAGAFTVTLRSTSNNGCVDSISKAVTVNPLPKPAFAINSINQCINTNSFSFADSSKVSTGSVTAWSWTFGDGGGNTIQNPTHSYTKTGSYTVLLKATTNAGCFDTVSRIVNILQKPAPAFIVNNTSQCLSGNNFVFTDKSTLSGGSITAWSWDFGDPASGSNSSALQNPTHVYTTAGSYTVKMRAYSAAGCVDSITKTITVYVKPTASFSISNKTQCLTGNSFSFTDQSTITSGKVSTWHWDFGDGGVSAAQSPGHSYTRGGTFTVTLKAYSDNGCVDSAKQTVKVYDKPTPHIKGDTSVCGGSTTSYTVNPDSGSTVTWRVTGGNIVSGNGTNTLSVYWPKFAAANVWATVVTPAGCKDSNNLLVLALPPVIAKIRQAPSVCPGGSIHFRDSSQSADKVLWHFGDPGSGTADTSTSRNPFHTYANAGLYTVKLNISNTYGCKDSNTQVVTVHPLPDAHFSMNYSGNQAWFHAQDSSLADSSYHWQFGDNGTGTGHSATHLYNGNKNYKVHLNLTSKYGCVNVMDSTVNVTLSSIETFENEAISLKIYPNPFHDNTLIKYTLKNAGRVQMVLYDITGKEMARLADQNQPAGPYEFSLSSGAYNLQPGTYTLKIMVNGGVVSRTLVRF